MFTVVISRIIALNIIPLNVTGNRRVRVYCFSDDTNEISFNYNKLCFNDCGYFTKMTSCCKDIEITENTTSSITCYRGALFITVYITLIENNNNVFKIASENESILECLENTHQSKYISDYLFEGELFYIQWAYLSREGDPTDYQTFRRIKKLTLPASGEILLCNNTKYQFQRNCDTRVQQDIYKLQVTVDEMENLMSKLETQLDILYRVCCYGVLVLCVIITISTLSLVLRIYMFNV